MFTSRAEYRLTLRADNADQRLTARGVALGCVGGGRAARFSAKQAAYDAARQALQSVSLSPNEASRHGLQINRDGVRRSAFEILSFPDVTFDRLRPIDAAFAGVSEATAAQIEIDAKYAVYLDRQAADISAFRRDEVLTIPGDLDYATLSGLSTEIRMRLERVRPETLGQAARIEGVTPTALTLLAAHVRKPRQVVA